MTVGKSYGERIDTLCSLLEKAETFADVGCDHGYCSEYMLGNGLCERAILSDVSSGSLKKAERLLADFIAEGRAKAVLGDGFFGVDESVDEVLIAGMGGSEIVEILSDEKHGFIPKKFLLQPMHDAEKLRRYLVAAGGYIERDFTFRVGKNGKFYDVIKGRRLAEGEPRQDYSETEYAFGRENLALLPQAFLQRTERLLSDVNGYLARGNLREKSRVELEERKRKLEEAMKGATGRNL